MENHSIIFFDGHCNLCNGFVDFVVRWDRSKTLKVASLQGETAMARLEPSQIEELSSVIFLDDGQLHSKTNAVLRIMAHMHWIFKPLILLLVIPSFIRDPFYNFIARNRYKFFGKKESCRLPSPEEQAFFLP